MKKLQFNIKGSRCDYSFHTQESDYARRMYNVRLVTDKEAGTFVLETEQGAKLQKRAGVSSVVNTGSGSGSGSGSDSGSDFRPDGDILDGDGKIKIDTGFTKVALRAIVIDPETTSRIFNSAKNYTCIGLYYTQDKLYVFFTPNEKNTNFPNDYIFEITIDGENNSYDVKTLISLNLNFSPEYPLQIVSYYESSVLHKLYFIDGINQLAVLNLLDVQISNFKSIESAASINNWASDITFGVACNGGVGLFNPGIMSFGVLFLNAYGATSSTILDSIIYDICDASGGSNASNVTLNQEWKITITYPKDLTNTFTYMRLYVFMKNTAEGGWSVLTCYPKKDDVEITQGKDLIVTVNANTLQYTFTWTNTGGETVSISDLNVQPTANQLISQTLCTNGEYLLLGNNNYSTVGQETSLYEQSLLTTDDVNIYTAVDRLIYMGLNVDNMNTVNNLRASNNLDITSYKWYFKSGEVYTLGYLLYYSSGQVSDIIPLCVNDKNYTILIPSWVDDKMNTGDKIFMRNRRYRHSIKVFLKEKTIKKLKEIDAVAIKFYYAKKLSLRERRIMALCAYVAGIHYYNHYSKTSLKGILGWLFPTQFFRPEVDSYYISRASKGRNFHDLYLCYASLITQSSFEDMEYQYLSFSNKMYGDAAYKYPKNIFCDYPTLSADAIFPFVSANAAGVCYDNVECDRYMIAHSSCYGQLVSPNIEKNTFDNQLLSYAEVNLVGSFIRPCLAVMDADNTSIGIYNLYHKFLNAKHRIELPVATGLDTSNGENKLTFTPSWCLWWGCNRGIGSNTYNHNFYSELKLLLTPINILLTGLNTITNSKKLYFMNKNSNYNNYINDYGVYLQNTINFSYTTLQRCYGKAAVYANGLYGYDLNATVNRQILTAVNLKSYNNSIWILAPFRLLYALIKNTSVYSNYSQDFPCLELINENFVISKSYEWIPASTKIEPLNIKTVTISNPTDPKYWDYINGKLVRKTKVGHEYSLDIGDTTISKYVCHVNYADAATFLSTVYTTVLNANGSEKFNVNGPDNSAVNFAPILYASLQGEGISTINSFLTVPIESNHTCYYDISQGEYYTIKSLSVFSINDVFDDQTPVVQFATWNKAEIKTYNFVNEILALGPKQPNSLQDKWLDLSPNNMQTYYLNGEYGAIKALKSVDNNLYAFTEKAIFKVGFNQSAALAGSTGELSMVKSPSFTGDYIISNVGCNDNEKVLQTKNGLYLLSNTHHELYSIQDDKVSAMGLMKFNKTALDYFDYSKWNPLKKTGSILRNNDHYEEVYIIDPNGNSISTLEPFSSRMKKNAFGQNYWELDHPKCFTYSERLGEFTSYYDYWCIPYWFFIGNKQYGITEDGKIMRLHTGEYNNMFYCYEATDTRVLAKKTNFPLWSQASFTIVHNADVDLNKTLYSISYAGGMYDIDGAPLNQQRANNRGFAFNTGKNFLMSALKSILIKNDYQDTNIKDLVVDLKQYNPYIPQYSKQKLQNWNILIPRDALNTIGKNKYNLSRIQNVWNEVSISLNNITTINDSRLSEITEITNTNILAKIWGLTLNYN